MRGSDPCSKGLGASYLVVVEPPVVEDPPLVEAPPVIAGCPAGRPPLACPGVSAGAEVVLPAVPSVSTADVLELAVMVLTNRPMIIPKSSAITAKRIAIVKLTVCPPEAVAGAGALLAPVLEPDRDAREPLAGTFPL